MGVPTEKELQQALTTAATMREQNNDHDFIAKSLLNLNHRVELLEKVKHYAKLYLRSGQGSQEHTLLLRAIDKAERAALNSTDGLDKF
ncbi:hypothetical protein [Pleionea mediterranea]|jgi:hypothetical protein|uniref:Uncharacterized protein n=1 Tax=Pleionea mediterranea TaxID=523701 RepID=A0A316FPB8_9GAMM|nr:hypothetical protein [Pleionea mediterranea]PWK50103.1 hypothetical protein C8D97_107270 [Pleionea mediterranea]